MSKKSSFKDIVNAEIPVVVDFYADWCGPCKTYSPIINKLKQEMGDQIIVVKIDVDKNQTITSNLQIRSIPTTMIFKKGEMLWRAVGAQPISELRRQVEVALG
ncbi:MAG: thioredoxin [Saprospiraceae bacterium]|nr:thioredoxin [Saprospiraceae bacterium]